MLFLNHYPRPTLLISPHYFCTLIARRFSAKSRQQHFIICMRNFVTERSSPLFSHDAAHSIKCQNVIAISILLIVFPCYVSNLLPAKLLFFLRL
jgi:hypothetical protein